MARYEIKDSDYKREVVEVELAQLAGTTFQLLKQGLDSAKDGAEIAYVFDTHLADFTKRYNEVNKKDEEINMDDPVMPVISHNKDDLLRFKKSVVGINNLLEEAKNSLASADYASYSKALRIMLNETDFHLAQLEKGEGDGGKMAA